MPLPGLLGGALAVRRHPRQEETDGRPWLPVAEHLHQPVDGRLEADAGEGAGRFVHAHDAAVHLQQQEREVEGVESHSPFQGRTTDQSLERFRHREDPSGSGSLIV